MKITEKKVRNGEGNSVKTVVVGIRLDSQSRELLTWSLVKVASAGDRVVALHVIGKSDIAIKDGKSSLFPLIKTFESILAVYEGFCNLKQIDLKLKICKGSSIRKVIVREAKLLCASKVVVGIIKNYLPFRYASIAKYCAKKLPADCEILAISNGKVVFHKESIPTDSTSQDDLQLCNRQSKVDRENNSLDTVPIQRLEAASCSMSLLLRVMPELKPGWTILQREIIPGKNERNSVVQWAMEIPDRSSSALVSFNYKPMKMNDLATNQSNLNSDRGEVLAEDKVCSVSNANITEKSTKFPKELEPFREKYSSVCKLFNYEEIRCATSNFSSDNLIGRGGNSEVYKCCLSDGKEVAVKVLKLSNASLNDFMLEIEIITTLHHKSIVSLLGFSFGDTNLLLIYNFLHRGSLEENLHVNKEKYTLSWSERYKVAVGVAEALDYLHTREKPVIHKDIKSSNILLSEDFEPQLCDFGFATWASLSSIIMCNDVTGTFGYMAPEYFMYGRVTEKIDVYAFGVVLLELLSGRKPISSEYSKGQESLVMWAKPILKDGKVTQLLDPSLCNSYDYNQMDRMSLAALLCTNRAPKSRPQIGLILKLLQGDQSATQWAKLQVGSSNELHGLDDYDYDDAYPSIPDIQSHLNIALLDIDEDDLLSICSIDQNDSYLNAQKSMEDYLKGRWSCSSGMDSRGLLWET